MSEKFDAALAKAKENLSKFSVHGDCDKRIGELEAEAARYYELSRALEQALTDKEDLLASARAVLEEIGTLKEGGGVPWQYKTARKWLEENKK